ncbi:ATP-binding protein [Actinoplanes ianthinogenes]|nr:ATP-binding protein [Actinoplanes ianthinogenes]
MHREDPPADSAPAGETGRWDPGSRIRAATDWFTTADALGDEVVSAMADWCAVHVRTAVVDALRSGTAVPLAGLGLEHPVDGEPLEMITLRHRDAEREPVIRLWAADVPVRTGDAYGAGRVTATGVTRYLPHVPPGLLHAAITSRQLVPQFEALGVASSIVVPLCTATGAVLGAVTLIRDLDQHDAFTERDVHDAERFGRLAADALDASRIATVTADRQRPQARHHRHAVWQPEHPRDAAVGAEGRDWARRTLPEILTRTPRPDLYDEVDLVLTELISNAVRHGGGLREAQLADTGDHLRLIAADDDPRGPAVRARQTDRPNGRGIHLIQAIADRWGVERHHTEPGKRVWADLRFS